MESVAEQIFSLLDVISLRAAEAVSKLWYSVIKKTKISEKLYQRSKLESPSLGQLFQRRICEGFNVEADIFWHKRLLNDYEKLKANWTTGNYSKKVIDAGRCTRFVMDSKRIIAINSTLSVTMWNRWTLEEECLPLQSNSALTELTHLELFEDYIFCSYRDGAFVVWDITTKSIRFKFQDEQMSGCDLKIYAAHGLIISFVSVVGHSGRYDQTRFCVRTISRPSEIVMQELTSRTPCSRVKDMASDGNYFIVFLYCSNDYIVSPKDFKIQLRSTNSFEPLHELDGIMSSSDIFSYCNGWLVVGSSSIRIWKIADNKSFQLSTSISKTSDTEYETQIADIQLDGQRLIVRDMDGTFTVWRFFENKQGTEILGSASIRIIGERVKRGYQKFKFDQLQIVSVHTHEDESKGRHDLLTLRNFV